MLSLVAEGHQDDWDEEVQDHVGNEDGGGADEDGAQTGTVVQHLGE